MNKHQICLKEFEEYERVSMSKNAWIVANELVNRIDGAQYLVNTSTVNYHSNLMKCSFSTKSAWRSINMPQQKERKRKCQVQAT